jgi:hypothetical protein
MTYARDATANKTFQSVELSLLVGRVGLHGPTRRPETNDRGRLKPRERRDDRPTRQRIEVVH